jgi:hypothetical protein
VAIAKRSQIFVVLDDTWNVQEYKVIGEEDPSEEIGLKFVKKLEMIPSAKKLLLDNQGSLFSAFSDVFLSNSNSLVI